MTTEENLPSRPWCLVSCGNGDYAITSRDVVWLARALWGECGRWAREQAYYAVAFCILQRFMRWPRGRELWNTWAAFIQAYSQPVNRKWAYPTDSRIAKYPKECSPERIARRRLIRRTPWDRLPRRCRRAAERVAMGLVSSPVPDAVDFGTRALCSKLGLEGVTIGGNTFTSNPRGLVMTDCEVELWI